MLEYMFIGLWQGNEQMQLRADMENKTFMISTVSIQYRDNGIFYRTHVAGSGLLYDIIWSDLELFGGHISISLDDDYILCSLDDTSSCPKDYVRVMSGYSGKLYEIIRY